jgi:DNA-binding CsgD family transcriptional regulator
MEANKALREEIKERTRAEKLLRDASENLEEIVEERTRDLEIKTKNLEDLNVALEVLLKKREEDKQDLEKNFVHNITNLVLPYIEKLKGANLTARQRSFIETIESNIHDIVAPFARGLSSEYFNLTPTEIRVATLIKQDKTAREIAEMHNVSKSAIVYHSHNIRKKLGLKDKKINLKTYLRSLQ